MEAALKGLVLAGGRSSRMGFSKAEIKWHGKEQQYYLADLLSSCCDEVFISCRKDQVDNIQSEYKIICDQYENAGPLEAITTAFEKYMHCSWLVIACDLPLMDLLTLHFLKNQRDTLKIATTFESPINGLPEPLAAIWEPESYNLLKLHSQQEHISLRKILTMHGAKTIKAPDSGALINVNSQEDAKHIREILAKRTSI